MTLKSFQNNRSSQPIIEGITCPVVVAGIGLTICSLRSRADECVRPHIINTIRINMGR
jgi:hypothetical protein